jgi:hypothetical protein
MRRRAKPPPIPIIGELHRTPYWCWLYCTARDCSHSAPFALAPAVIRWGCDASSDLLRERARCSCCGHKGTTLRHPSWGGSHVGWKPFQTAKMLGITETLLVAADEVIE